MKGTKCLESDSLRLLAYMFIIHFTLQLGHVEIAVAYAIIATVHLNQMMRK
jgi:hypothetical protein